MAIDKNSIYYELYNKVNKTSKHRFYAQNRLNRHNNLSLWTIITYSLIIILFSMLSLINFDLGSDYIKLLKDKNEFIEFSLLFFSIVILTISTALTMSNFGIRAEKSHDCGRELNALALKLELVKDQNDDAYQKHQELYEGILAKYDNHKTIDYKEYQLSYFEIKSIQDNFKYLKLFLSYYIALIFEFLVYIVLGLSLLFWFKYLLF